MNRILAALAASMLLAVAAHARTTLRCDHDLVEVGDPTAELLLVCGEPMLRQVVGIEKTEDAERVVEHWTYHFGPGTLLQIVRLEGGVITDVMDGARQ